MQRRKKSIKISLFLVLLFGIIPYFVYAQGTEQQQASLSIQDGLITIYPPDNFSFESTFLPVSSGSPFYLTKVLKPLNPETSLIVKDTNTSGQNFYVTMSLSNLIDENDINVIPFENFSFVTLANDLTTGIDNSPNSPEPDTAGMTAPMTCPWDGQPPTELLNECEIYLDANTLEGDVEFIAGDPALNISSTTQYIPVNDSSFYNVNEILTLSNGEKCLIERIDSPTQIYVRRGILETSAVSHNAGSGITSSGPESLQYNIMTGPEPPAESRVGEYSFGFGLRALVDTSLSAGNYTGTITYTLYQY